MWFFVFLVWLGLVWIFNVVCFCFVLFVCLFFVWSVVFLLGLCCFVLLFGFVWFGCLFVCLLKLFFFVFGGGRKREW